MLSCVISIQRSMPKQWAGYAFMPHTNIDTHLNALTFIQAIYPLPPFQGLRLLEKHSQKKTPGKPGSCAADL